MAKLSAAALIAAQQIKTREEPVTRKPLAQSGDVASLPPRQSQQQQQQQQQPQQSSRGQNEGQAGPPRTGVEVMSVDTRDDVRYYTMRDLRNGNVVKNVTQKSARRLWHYAITAHAELPNEINQARFIQWHGPYGLIRRQKQGNQVRYDFIQKLENKYRYYFGVTDDGLHGPWRELVGVEED